MSDTLHYTATLNPRKTVNPGKQKQHWLEFQLVDEQGEPLAGMPYRAVNDATRADIVPEFTGLSDAQGVIRFEGLHPITLTLLLAADPLAELLQGRRLRAVRPEPPRPGFGDRTPLYGPQRSGFSPIEAQAIAAGHRYHYVRIGQLCDQLPSLDPPLDPDDLPPFHFPDPAFAGFGVEYEDLNRRHVLEVCPFRAWSLVLHHQAEYSLVNAYNLSLMSILAYSDDERGSLGSVEEFFLQQCLDLSRSPQAGGNGRSLPSVVIDVPFSGRYSEALMLDTAQADIPEGDTQLFYAVNSEQVLVAWRGTASLADLATDLTFRPVKSEAQEGCEPKVMCTDLTPEGKVHLGFREGFDVARKVFAKHLVETIPREIDTKKLFICGHSLGGALGLVHAAALKARNPLLYTYGMPRTFTFNAVQQLSAVRHFRHVNDIDPIPSVPPEAALDNYLYNLYGPLGTTLGFAWSAVQMGASAVLRHGDPFCHHGEIAMFFRAEQHVRQQGSRYPAYRSKDGLGAPYYNKIARRLSEKAKLFLVPSLSPHDNQQAEHAQEHLTKTLDGESRAKFFPPYSNPKTGRLLGILNHLMDRYQPYLYGQLLESISAERSPLLKRQVDRQAFERQMQQNLESLAPHELERNRLFLELQARLPQALLITQQSESGMAALQRFDAVADPQACFEKAHC